jgi:hypothetical protein
MPQASYSDIANIDMPSRRRNAQKRDYSDKITW